MRKEEQTISRDALQQSVVIPLPSLVPNKGQIEGLPANPRSINVNKFKKLKASIQDDPEMLALRELLVYPYGTKFVIIGGNMRYQALKELGYTEAICKVIPKEATPEQLRAVTIKDNNNFGDWDFEELANEWDNVELDAWGVDLPPLEDDADDDKEKDEGNKEEDIEGDDEEESFFRSMYKDVLYESNNKFEIPNLLLEMQAGKVELPLSPWGANSRLRKDVATYHFYVDDYRFEALFKDPIKLLTSGCKAVVEPNCSCHDQTPIAWGIHLIYKKRWFARYLQECGIKVYADLNVSHKFIEYNKMGLPQGYNAFFTRGLDGWMNSLKSDLQVAQEISGLERPNLVVYGGGDEIQEFCRTHSLLYITDFINAKK